MIIILGFPIEGLTLLLVFTPILAPMGPALGYDPVHWGVVLVMAINLAGITPPVGGCIYLVAGMAKATIDETTYYLWPFLAVWTIVTFLILAFPQTVLYVPNLLLPLP
jgi:TRAP-type C4-dicarboxylate transport system permease large subunit